MSNEYEPKRDTLLQELPRFLISASVGGAIIMGSYLFFGKLHEFFGLIGFFAMVFTMLYLEENNKPKD